MDVTLNRTVWVLISTSSQSDPGSLSKFLLNHKMFLKFHQTQYKEWLQRTQHVTEHVRVQVSDRVVWVVVR